MKVSSIFRQVTKIPSTIWAISLKTKVQKIFSSKYLLLTNTIITMGLSGTGDIMQQKYEIYQKRQSEWNPKRTRQIVTTGMLIGPCCHFWYQYLDKILPGRTFKIVGKKILMDQVFFSPFNISLFLVVLGLLEGEKLKNIFEELKDKGAELLIAEWIIWPPAQMVNFCFLPTRYRVLYDNTVSLGFDYYYSFVKFRKNDSEDNVSKASATAINSADTNWRKEMLPPSHTFVGITCQQQRLLAKHLRDTRRNMFIDSA